jgi:hypothetical protein
MKLNKKLPKYIKRFYKEKAIQPLSNYGLESAFLLISLPNPFAQHNNIYASMKHEIVIEQLPLDRLYYFETFKYLMKYKDYLRINSMTSDEPLVKIIKSHLMLKFNRVLIDEHETIFGSAPDKEVFRIKMIQLKEFNDFLNYCFSITNKDTKISLVIQKKIGYKYYENVNYY